VREYQYTVDRDGRIFHDGTEVVDPATLKFFLRAMQRTSDDRCLVVCQNDHNWFRAEDTPFVIQRLRLTIDSGDPRRNIAGDQLKAVELCFAGDYREPLAVDSLESDSGQLFCRIRNGTWRVRFGRIALQQIAPFLVEDVNGPALVVGGVSHAIHRACRDCAGVDA
jgi:hypothetical protein